jgi:predicted transcriptional regulator
MEIGMNVAVNGNRIHFGIAKTLREARIARGYAMDDVAETSGLTVAEVAALEAGVDVEPRRMSRFVSAVGLRSF